MRLFIFTAQYPYGSGEAYLDLEIPFLEKSGFKITFVPEKSGGEIKGRNLSMPYEIIEPVKHKSLPSLNSLTSLFVHHRSFRTLLWTKQRVVQALQVMRASEITRDLLKQSQDEPIVLYSYWLTSRVMGIRSALNANQCQRALLVSRAHRYEMFGDEYDDWTLGERVLACDEVYSVSSVGAEKLRSSVESLHYSKVYTSFIGVQGPKCIDISCQSKTIRCVSVSWVYPLKQVHLILMALHSAAKLQPESQFIWTHIGDGPDLKDLQERAEQLKLPNLEVRLVGKKTNIEVMQDLAKGDYDVFLNASKIEGVPVSIMEAMAAGLCIIAPHIGGIPDVVQSSHGILVPLSSLVSGMAESLVKLVNDSELMLQMRQQAREKWESTFTLQNLEEFAVNLYAKGQCQRQNTR